MGAEGGGVGGGYRRDVKMVAMNSTEIYIWVVGIGES
jgi:hypothetical protein